MKYKLFIFLILMAFQIEFTTASAEESFSYLIQASGKYCKHGLHAQPNGGPFSIFLFCDDALGSNIGVINTEPGAGPGAIQLTEAKVWDKWYTFDRFWQEKEWATDVVNFAWSPSLRYIYVATSRIYGDGGLFRLDLKERTAVRLLPTPKASYFSRLDKVEYYTYIDNINVKKKLIRVKIYTYDTDKALIAAEDIHLE